MLQINSFGCVLLPSMSENSVVSECLQVGCKIFLLCSILFNNFILLSFMGDVSNST